MGLPICDLLKARELCDLLKLDEGWRLPKPTLLPKLLLEVVRVCDVLRPDTDDEYDELREIVDGGLIW